MKEPEWAGTAAVVLGISIAILPFVILVFALYVELGGDFLLILTILGILAYVILLIVCLKAPSKPDESTPKPVSRPETDVLSPSTKFMAAMLGATVLGKPSKKKEKSIFDSARDDLFWQEKYRRNNRYDECDDDDCDDCCDHEF